MKFMKNRIIIASVAILTATVLAIVLYTQASNQAQKTDVVVVTQTIPQGTVITKDMVKITQVGGYGLPEDIARDIDDVTLKYAKADLYPNDYVLTTKLGDNLQSIDPLSTLNGTKVAVSVTIKEFADGLSDKLIPQDIVSCIVSDSKGSATIPKELTYMQVIAVTDSTGVDKQSDEKTEDSENMATVTLLATPKQAELLAQYEDTSEIHFALVYRGDTDTANQFLQTQEQFQ